MVITVDSNGFLETLLESITHYKKDNSLVEMADKCEITSKGRKILWMNTQGWKLKVLQINGAET